MGDSNTDGLQVFLDLVPEYLRPQIEPFLREQYDSLTPVQQSAYTSALPLVQKAVAGNDFTAFFAAVKDLDPRAEQYAPMLWGFAQQARRNG